MHQKVYFTLEGMQFFLQQQPLIYNLPSSFWWDYCENQVYPDICWVTPESQSGSEMSSESLETLWCLELQSYVTFFILLIMQWLSREVLKMRTGASDWGHPFGSFIHSFNEYLLSNSECSVLQIWAWPQGA